MALSLLQIFKIVYMLEKGTYMATAFISELSCTIYRLYIYKFNEDTVEGPTLWHLE